MVLPKSSKFLCFDKLIILISDYPHISYFPLPGGSSYGYGGYSSSQNLDGSGFFGPFLTCVRTGGGWIINCDANASRYRVYGESALDIDFYVFFIGIFNFPCEKQMILLFTEGYYWNTLGESQCSQSNRMMLKLKSVQN